MVTNALLGKKTLFIIAAGVLSLLLLLPATGTALSPKQSSTRIVLDTPLNEVNNGDTMIFTGKLLNALDGVGIPSTEVTIYHKGLQQYYELASGLTDSDGYFKISWMAKPVDPLSNKVSVFATFDGNVEYKPSRTFEYNIDVVTKYFIDVRADKQFYHVGDKAIFTIKIAGPTNNPFDPKDMHAFLDGMLVTANKIDAGHYRYISKELTHGIHNFSVNAKIPTAESKFRTDFNSISASGQIHVIKRPTTMTASIDKEVYFIGDEIKIDATLLDVIRGGYITDKNLTGNFALPDQTERNFTFSLLGNSYDGKYVIQEDDATGMWIGSVTFDGDYALQSSQAPLESFKVNDYRVKATVTQQSNVTIINFQSHEDNEIDVYEVVVKLGEESIVSMLAPSGWSSVVDNATNSIYFSTDTKPIKSGKALEFQVETSELIQSYSWETRDIDSNVILSGNYPA